MDAIRGGSEEHDPERATVPTVLPGIHRLALVPRRLPRLRRLRLLPAAAHGPLRPRRRSSTAPTSASTSRDLGFADALLPRAPAAARMREAEREPEKLRLGGMALRNGLLVHGPTHWAAAVRARDGEIRVASGPKPRVRAVDDVPGLRGVVRLGEAIAVIPLVKRALPEARLPFQSGGVIAATAGARRRPARCSAAADAASPARPPRRRSRWRRRCSRCAAATWPPTTASSTRRSPPTSRATPTRPTPPRSTTAAARTWSLPLLASNVAGAALLQRARRAPGPLANGAVARRARSAAAVEVFAWSERHAGTRLARALRRPGLRAPARRSARASPTRSSSRSAAPRSPRSCASRVRSRRRPGPSAMAITPAAQAPEPRRLPPPRRADPRGLLLGRLLQPHQDAARGRRAPPARAHAGLPEEATRCWAASTRRSRSSSVLGAPATRRRRWDRRLGRARRARALRGRRDRAVRDRADDRGRLHPVRPPGDRLPRLPGAAHADHAQRRARSCDAARGKPIFYFPARHDHWLVQTGDGWAAHVAGAIGVSTDAQASWWGGRGIGTVPHGADRRLRRRHGARRAQVRRPLRRRDERHGARRLRPTTRVRTALAVADALGDGSGACASTPPRRSSTASLWERDGRASRRPGSTRSSSRRSARALDAAGHRARADRRLRRLRRRRASAAFEAAGVPVDAYGVGLLADPRRATTSPPTS